MKFCFIYLVSNSNSLSLYMHTSFMQFDWLKEKFYTLIKFRALLFKTNDVISLRIVKTLIIKYAIYANIFAEKNVSSFCICKSYSHFISKNTCI